MSISAFPNLSLTVSRSSTIVEQLNFLIIIQELYNNTIQLCPTYTTIIDFLQEVFGP